MLADMLGWDYAKMSDLMNGKGGTSEIELAQLLGVCRIKPDECAHLLELFRVSREKGWWQLHDGVMPVNVRTLVEHEDAAIELIFWSLNMIPGLLQTPGYMRAVMRVWPSIPQGEIELRVDARLARQEILERGRVCTFYVHEQVLRAEVGGREVMSDQLHHLLRMLVRPHITLRVVPVSIGAHAGMAGSFHLMKFARIQPVVHVEGENSSQFLEDTASIKVYTNILESLDRTALDAEQSRRLITHLAT
ncbi:hypothetical protein Lesp02_67840 [Lentzea sp. NBRC 105346]|nr:hypothetical protein Lesp02_67840 [Lentzea sp. NBRC 105346]